MAHTYSTELSCVFESVHTIERDIERQYPLDLIHALSTGTSYFLRKFRTTGFEEKLRQVLVHNRFEVTLIESAYMGVYLPVLTELAERAGRIILRLQNVEYEILERLAAQARRGLYRALLRREARLFREHELSLVRQVGDVRAITERDAQILSRESGAPIGVLDPFIDLDEYSPAAADQIEPYSLTCIGNMGWLPNRNGILWFCETVWPRVARAFPTARLYVVGKSPPTAVRRLASQRVVVTGHVDDARPYFHRSQLLIVPLMEGSGVRIKILTALAMGKRVLSTAVGAEGIDYPGLEIKETPEEWFAAIERVFQQPPKVDEEAAAYARARFDWRRELILS
jgi:glycosyltransferase involved in cell wall biosynthesis